MNKKVLHATKTYSSRLIDEGAEAIVLFGSWVRGDAYEESDIDIHVVGTGAPYTLERYQGYLLSVSWATQKQHLKTFRVPSKVCGVIPAWRNSFIIYDPHGIAMKLKQQAERWNWDSFSKKADKWVARELTGYAEEAHRLVGNLQMKRRSAASVVRSILAIRMAPILAVHYRIFYETENLLWDFVSARMGTEWKRIQSISFGEGEKALKTLVKQPFSYSP